MSDRINPQLETLRRQLADGRLDRREFLRFATLLGVAAPAAYAMAGLGPMPRARAADMPHGGTLRVGTRVKELKSPHTYSWGGYDSNFSRQVVEYLTLTDRNNVTHPYLLEKWAVSPDLKTWTLTLRQGIKWHNGQDFTADDVVWNLKQLTDAAVGSSFVGLVKAYLLTEVPDGTDASGKPKTTTKLWDANAIEKVDAHTVRLNCKAPQIAVPEHLFHYPAAMLYPGDKGVFQPGAQGTGAFEFASVDIGKRAVLTAHKGYWGQGPYLDGIEFIDLGDDAAAPISALASRQIHGLLWADPMQYDALKAMDFLAYYDVSTSETAVLRFKVTEKPWTDPRVRKAMRLGLKKQAVMEVALRGIGEVGDHTHVSPAQPDYKAIPPMNQDIDEAKKLLAEAGFPDGFDTVMYVPNDLPWIVAQCQAAAEQWKAIGVRVKLNVMPGAQYWDVWTKVPFGATIWYHRPLGMMILGLAYRSGVPWNETSYSNPEFDKLLAQAEGTLDIDKRRDVMAQLEIIMHQDGPIAQPLWRRGFTFWDKKVQGFEMHPSNYFFGNRIALAQGA
ncbi:MAG TPA: ABC transporter substrate-binding protein [Acetobacteraceae bacterium]|nr:ABC transporter substrate-binding protein [Acetobacteraceae bacterium]